MIMPTCPPGGGLRLGAETSIAYVTDHQRNYIAPPLAAVKDGLAHAAAGSAGAVNSRHSVRLGEEGATEWTTASRRAYVEHPVQRRENFDPRKGCRPLELGCDPAPYKGGDETDYRRMMSDPGVGALVKKVPKPMWVTWGGTQQSDTMRKLASQPWRDKS